MQAEVIRTAREGDGAARAEALTLAPGRCTERLLDSLLAGLHDPSPDVRIAVARRLSDVETPQVHDALAAALDAERDPAVARHLLGMLEQPGDQRMIDRARRWLSDPVAGQAAARALGEADTWTAVVHLRGVISDAAIPGPTRAAAAKAIGGCGRWDAVWLLLPLLDDPDADVRAGAVDGLGALVYNGLRLWNGGYGGHDGYGAEDDVRRLVRALDDPQEPVRYSAALGLKRWVAVGLAPPPDPDALYDRLTTLVQDPSPRLRQAAADALQALADPVGPNSSPRKTT
ncbi:HEAT repeat domain-containing protein [Streptomyces sp. NBC_00878]|uniref:HEAT repeat domain-containing protein n=1 Tax=Streptomyces sp. NBC_00878 TaxID=2975854 RepID=UPI00225A6E70|nr:HEAT repeat domain-containing protein [Streptomyces sp. NBC_00878]MCX4911592.1 HEAT repeat domain-containing protein [Streptomyces sp. NBC_00878]